MRPSKIPTRSPQNKRLNDFATIYSRVGAELPFSRVRLHAHGKALSGEATTILSPKLDDGFGFFPRTVFGLGRCCSERAASVPPVAGRRCASCVPNRDR